MLTLNTQQKIFIGHCLEQAGIIDDPVMEEVSMRIEAAILARMEKGMAFNQVVPAVLTDFGISSSPATTYALDATTRPSNVRKIFVTGSIILLLLLLSIYCSKKDAAIDTAVYPEAMELPDKMPDKNSSLSPRSFAP